MFPGEHKLLQEWSTKTARPYSLQDQGLVDVTLLTTVGASLHCVMLPGRGKLTMALPNILREGVV